MKDNNTFKSLPTYGEIESGLFKKSTTKGKNIKNIYLKGKSKKKLIRL